MQARGKEERVSQSKLFIYNLGIIDKQTNGQMPRWDNYHLKTLNVSYADVKILTKDSSTAQGAQKRLRDKSSFTVSVRNERDLRRERERKGDHLSDHRLDAKDPSIKDFDQDARAVFAMYFCQEISSSSFYGDEPQDAVMHSQAIEVGEGYFQLVETSITIPKRSRYTIDQSSFDHPGKDWRGSVPVIVIVKLPFVCSLGLC